MLTRSRDTSWPVALITGASSGIGETMAMQLAKTGSEVVLVARRRERLDAVAAAIGARGGRAEVIVADLADPEDLYLVAARLSDEQRPVDLLVNNAGFGTHGPFASLPVYEEEQEVRVNVLAPIRLTRAALPGMLGRRRGGIINISSLASLQPIPYWATYAATKAYLTSFSLAVHEEVKSSGVTVLAVLPGFIRTEFQQRENLGLHTIPGPLWMSADDVSKAALRAVAKGRATCVPGLGYRVFAALSRVTPWSISRRIGRAGSEMMP
ncbi:MAG TPA: SDR family oxidoreductase [Acidimicrobiales bacterium]|nr:SDR family oxidoreductase [Acidimicrobiales bacterium]